VKVKRFFGKNKVPVHHVVNLYPDESDYKSFTVIRHLLGGPRCLSLYPVRNIPLKGT
jgi:hypothetical protein